MDLKEVNGKISKAKKTKTRSCNFSKLDGTSIPLSVTLVDFFKT